MSIEVQTKNAFDWLKKLDLKDIPIVPSKAMWCGHRSHVDYSNRFPWIVKKLFDSFNFRIYIEIGIAGAGGIKMAYKYLSKYDDYLIIGIDPLKELPESRTANKAIFKKSKVKLIRKESEHALGDLRRILGNKKADVIVIDGDHTERCAMKDFEMYMPMLKVGGLMWFDDIAHEPGVGRAWKKIKNKNTSCVVNYDFWDWGVGEIEGGKKRNGSLGIDGAWLTRLS